MLFERAKLEFCGDQGGAESAPLPSAGTAFGGGTKGTVH